MKSFFLIFLIIITSDIYSQVYLEGEYVNNIKETTFMNEYITFYKNGSFNLIQYHCTGKTIGKGKYDIVDDSLKLYFDNPKSNEITSKPNKSSIISFIPKPNSTTSSNIIVFDSDGSTSLPFVNISIIDSLILDSTLTITHTDFDGKATINNEIGNTIIIKYVGYDELRIPISNMVDNDLNIFLEGIDSCTFYLNAGDNVSLSINELKKNSFKIDRFNDGYYYKYSKN